jgi:hypothetical protein
MLHTRQNLEHFTKCLSASLGNCVTVVRRPSFVHSLGRQARQPSRHSISKALPHRTALTLPSSPRADPHVHIAGRLLLRSHQRSHEAARPTVRCWKPSPKPRHALGAVLPAHRCQRLRHRTAATSPGPSTPNPGLPYTPQSAHARRLAGELESGIRRAWNCWSGSGRPVAACKQ